MKNLKLMYLIFYIQFAAIGFSQPQTGDDLQQLIECVATDKELSGLLFSYNYHGDHPLFIRYNKVIKNAMDTSKYLHFENWRYGIDYVFNERHVYLREDAFLFGEIDYYLQFDSIRIDDLTAFVALRANTISHKLKSLFYFRGEIEFEKRNEKWYIKRKKIVEKDKTNPR